VLRALDTTAAFPTTDGGEAAGGSFGGGAGPVVRDGRIVLSSGYGIYNHMAGNLLLVLRVPEPATP
jgi:polyvinyl alcohol dehydrogenase (cytochrome)